MVTVSIFMTGRTMARKKEDNKKNFCFNYINM